MSWWSIRGVFGRPLISNAFHDVSITCQICGVLPLLTKFLGHSSNFSLLFAQAGTEVNRTAPIAPSKKNALEQSHRYRRTHLCSTLLGSFLSPVSRACVSLPIPSTKKSAHLRSLLQSCNTKTTCVRGAETRRRTDRYCPVRLGSGRGISSC